MALEVRARMWVSGAQTEVSAGLFPPGGSRRESTSVPFSAAKGTCLPAPACAHSSVFQASSADSPSGPVVKTLPSSVGGSGSVRGWGSREPTCCRAPRKKKASIAWLSASPLCHLMIQLLLVYGGLWLPWASQEVQW